MQGAMGNNAAKITQLNSMIESYPGSVWLNDARLELTQAYIADGKLSQAQKTADNLRDKASDTSQARKAALAVAAANYDAGNASQAISDYKALIRRWPTSDEASQAVTDLKTIYANSGNIDEYIAFLNTVPNAPRPDASELESLTFEAAVKKMEANPTDPTPMNEYLAKYPSGTNADQALLYVATAQNDAGNSSEALKTLDKLLTSRPDSRAVPAALMMKANLLQEAGNNSKAAETWKKLLQTGGALYAPDAYTGLMQTASKPADVISYADKLLSLSSLSAEEVNEANLRKALALKEQGKTAECSALLQTIIVADQASQQGAEATVALSEILLSQGKTSDAEKHLLAFINSDTDSQYWLAKAYIALADTYKAQGNTYKAKEYLKALKSNYPGNEADITSAIQTRLSSWK
jgi:TolA-binding protein